MKLPLHLLGWKAFQDLAVAVAEECLRRPVQSFLPTRDAGRDGAFVGKWEGEDPAAGESTIQCKFTSKETQNLTLSLLDEEIAKARELARRGLAVDYIILTNHSITGASELQIKAEFEKNAGVGRCRIFGYDWIVRQIKTSPRLRMMAPRIYGLGDLSELLDARAYGQAQMILSSMSSDLQRLVVTDAHRRSVRAISEHNLVLLLGAPAAGKSTIGASIAIGAADVWQHGTIRATSPEDIKLHLNPTLPQFFWIDDAWGNTQYQRQTAEQWNQVFPLMQGAIQRGTRFLITSRDYIWNAAQRDLKLQAIPVLRRSQVVINVQELSTQERAQILYNHLKLGDQPQLFRREVKAHLPELSEHENFLPETARRLGTRFFSRRVNPTRERLLDFFERPEEFLLETINNLSSECLAAIAVVYLNGSRVRSPVAPEDLASPATAFGVSEAGIRAQLEALDGSLLLLSQDEHGGFWTYKHPTVSDAFSRYVAASPEKIEIYLRGAKPESLLREVVCSGISIGGSPVIVPNSLHDLLFERIGNSSAMLLRSFLSYRSNEQFSQLVLKRKPDVLLVSAFISPIAEDTDTSLFIRLYEQGVLPEDARLRFVEAVREAVAENADSSAFDGGSVEGLMTDEEKESILMEAKESVLNRLWEHVRQQRAKWKADYPPEDHFTVFQTDVERLIERVLEPATRIVAKATLRSEIYDAVSEMNEGYEAPSSTAAPTALSRPANAALANLFRDVDE